MTPKTVQLTRAITIPGTKLLGAISIQPLKHPEAVMTITPEGLLVEQGDIIALVPFSNIDLIIAAKPEIKRNDGPKSTTR